MKGIRKTKSKGISKTEGKMDDYSLSDLKYKLKNLKTQLSEKSLLLDKFSKIIEDNNEELSRNGDQLDRLIDDLSTIKSALDYSRESHSIEKIRYLLQSRGMKLKKELKDLVVDVKDLNVYFGDKQIIHDVSFNVKEGEIIGLFGISGAGKTTIIRVLTCQIPKKNWDGSVKVTDLTPAESKYHSKILSNLGYVPQLEQLNLYYDITPMKNVETFASTYGMSSKEAMRTAEDLFKILDIPEDTWKKPLKKMSGGEKKRVSMALGLIHKPKALFLDEPTTGVDASKRYEILSYLKKLNQQLNTTMFIITHDLEAALICDKAAILRDGRLLEFDTPENLISSLPSKELLARFTIENLTEKKIKVIRKFVPVEKTIRAGNEVIEIFMIDFEENLPKFIKYMMANGLNVTSMSRDKASFRRYFQLRIQEEEEKERLKLSLPS
jgi:ABC-2 type transport system ATP-binding protein